ncbi:hypothetical protein O3P69_020319 [Scylla paramamosain]|uniref:Uncharacterized protein n=1 Tax=Scylla paramamosain TaxID=85552 RepID=A0AAW0SK39_SCYPA
MCWAVVCERWWAAGRRRGRWQRPVSGYLVIAGAAGVTGGSTGGSRRDLAQQKQRLRGFPTILIRYQQEWTVTLLCPTDSSRSKELSVQYITVHTDDQAEDQMAISRNLNVWQEH